MPKNSKRRTLSPAFSVLSVTPSPAQQTGAALARRALNRSDRVAPVAGERRVPRMLGQLCPICREENATVEVRIGPMYSKIGEKCLGSGLHVLRLLGKLTS